MNLNVLHFFKQNHFHLFRKALGKILFGRHELFPKKLITNVIIPNVKSQKLRKNPEIIHSGISWVSKVT